ncbi:hypothetical protein ACFLSI_04065, partial [Bacteroidota bacterium]
GYTYDETLVAVGDTVIIGIVANSNGDVNLTNVTVKVNEEVNYTKGINSENYSFDYIITKSTLEEELWEFSVTDKNGNSASVTVTLNKDPDSEFGAVNNYPSVILGGQENDSLGGFFSFSENTLYNLQAAYNYQSVIDLVYYYYGSDKNTICSPGANIEAEVFNSLIDPGSWDTKRTTMFIKTSLSIADYNSIVLDNLLISSYSEANAKRKAKELAVNDIYSFKTENGKLGLFLVKSITGAEEGIIEVSIKIQE